MAVTIVALKNGSQPAANSRALTFDAAWTPALNDLVVFWTTAESIVTSITVQAGWGNPLGGNTLVQSDANALVCVYHFVTAGEVTAVTRTYSAVNLFTNSRAGATAGVVLRGVDPDAPIDSASSTFSSTDTATPHTLPGLTGANLANNSFVLSGIGPDGNESYTTPTGWTQQISQVITVGRNIWVGSQDALTIAGANISDVSITPSAGDEYCAITVAFAPLVSATSPTGATFTLTGSPPTISVSSGPPGPPAPGAFLMFLSPRKGAGDPSQSVVHDAGLNEEFVFAAETTGATRSVLDYGATLGNSSNDDRPAFNAAIAASAAGDEVFLPNGVYDVKSAISLKNGVNIRGESEAGVIINTRMTSLTSMVMYLAEGDGDVILENFTIQKASGSDFKAGIRFSDPDLTVAGPAANERLIVRNVTIKNHNRFGIESNNTKHLLVENCHISNAVALDGNGSGYGVILGGPRATNNWVRSNVVGPVIRHALLVVNFGNHNLIELNEVFGCVSGAIDMHGEDEYSNEIRLNVIHDEVLDGTTISPNGAGIEMGEPPSGLHGKTGMYNWAHHNEVYNCPQGMRIMNQTNNTYFEDNWFHDCDDGILIDQTSGYALTGVDSPIIRRNTIENCGNGIRLVNIVTNAIVEDNIIINNTGYGIFTDSQTTGYLIRRNTITGNGTNVSLGSPDGIYEP